MASREKLSEFSAWCAKHGTGDEKGQAQIFLDRLFQAFGQAGALDRGGQPKFRVRKAAEEGGGVSFAAYGCNANPISAPMAVPAEVQTAEKIRLAVI